LVTETRMAVFALLWVEINRILKYNYTSIGNGKEKYIMIGLGLIWEACDKHMFRYSKVQDNGPK